MRDTHCNRFAHQGSQGELHQCDTHLVGRCGTHRLARRVENERAGVRERALASERNPGASGTAAMRLARRALTVIVRVFC